jgi:rSAM/selenodomain-associated transferase 2
MRTISVIIPTLNEGENIVELLSYLHDLDSSMELIVSDGGSDDETITIAEKYCTVVRAARGRGVQMNAGAKRAKGDILWFIHADCIPHPDSKNAIFDALSREEVVGGAFEYNLDEKGFLYRWTEFNSNFKNRVFKLFCGDMGIFVRRDVFQQIRGYKEIPLMEDMDFCKRLKKMGNVVVLPQRINTSARRWEEEGKMKNLIRNWLLQLGWTFGIDSKILANWYRFK